MDNNIEYLKDMYVDGYFPDYLVDKIRGILQGVERFIAERNRSVEQIQEKLDEAIDAINDLEQEFDDNDSEIETVASESIGKTVEAILKRYDIPIDTEEAIRNRDW